MPARRPAAARVSATLAPVWLRMLAAAAAILFMAATLYLFLAMLDYHVGDMDAAKIRAGAPVQNRAGPLGAWLAEWAFWLFGYAAYLLSLLLLWPLLARFVITLRHGAVVMALRILGFALLLGAVSTLLTLGMDRSVPLSHGAGGWFGAQLAAPSQAIFGQIGVWLALSALALVGLTLYAAIAWLQVGNATVHGLRRFSTRCAQFIWAVSAGLARAYHGWRGWAEARAERRELPEPPNPRRGEQKQPRQKQPRTQRIEPTLRGSSMDRMPAISATGEDLPVTRRRRSPERRPPAAPSAAPVAEKPARRLPGAKPPRPPAAKPSRLPGAKPPRPPAAKPSRLPGAKPPRPPARSRGPSAALPSVDLLSPGPAAVVTNTEEIRARATELENRLADFGIKAAVSDVLAGPMIMRFEVAPQAGVKASRISALANDLARAMAVSSVRVVEVIPGKSVVGVELPNAQRRPVALRDVLETAAYQRMSSPMALGLGQDIAGEAVVADLAEMPHLLVAGTTGAGKSVALNTMLLSMLCNAGPERLRLLLIDPKMLELSLYEGIPHLLTPVVTDMKQAAQALRWCVAEMERRYQLMSKMGVRSLAAYNKKLLAHPPAADADAEPAEPLPGIVVVIDEFADMIMVVGKRVEESIIRVAQKARAAGIHLVLATQRPSVNVITGLIKANIPARIALKVPSRIDSRTVLDQGGAEQLLGHGDMLFLQPGSSLPIRLQGAFVSDPEVNRVVADWKGRVPADYLPSLLPVADGDGAPSQLDRDEEQDALYPQAVAMVTERRQVSISSLQRRFRIGYNRAARLVDGMQAAGIVSEMDEKGTRTVLGPKS